MEDHLATVYDIVDVATQSIPISIPARTPLPTPALPQPNVVVVPPLVQQAMIPQRYRLGFHLGRALLISCAVRLPPWYIQAQCYTQARHSRPQAPSNPKSIASSHNFAFHLLLIIGRPTDATKRWECTKDAAAAGVEIDSERFVLLLV